MIKSFRNDELEKFWTRGDDIKSVPTELTQTVAQVLDLLDAAVKPEDMFVPGLRRYQFKEVERERYDVIVAIGWRLSYDWEDDSAIDVDIELVI